MTLADHKRGAIFGVVCRTAWHAEKYADNVSAVTNRLVTGALMLLLLAVWMCLSPQFVR